MVYFLSSFFELSRNIPYQVPSTSFGTLCGSFSNLGHFNKLLLGGRPNNLTATFLQICYRHLTWIPSTPTIKTEKYSNQCNKCVVNLAPLGRRTWVHRTNYLHCSVFRPLNADGPLWVDSQYRPFPVNLRCLHVTVATLNQVHHTPLHTRLEKFYLPLKSSNERTLKLP